MPKITFVNEKKEIEVPAGANLREEAKKAGIQVYKGVHKYLNCFGFGLCERAGLNNLPLAIEAIEFAGEPRTFDRVFAEEKIDAERRSPDATASVDARTEQEAEMPRLRWTAKPRHVHQRSEPFVIPPAQRQEALTHVSAIQSLQRHHVGNRAKCNEIKMTKQIRLCTRGGPKTAPTQFTIDDVQPPLITLRVPDIEYCNPHVHGHHALRMDASTLDMISSYPPPAVAPLQAAR